VASDFPLVADSLVPAEIFPSLTVFGIFSSGRSFDRGAHNRLRMSQLIFRHSDFSELSRSPYRRRRMPAEQNRDTAGLYRLGKTAHRAETELLAAKARRILAPQCAQRLNCFVGHQTALFPISIDE
jgi:hypothetical protein